MKRKYVNEKHISPSRLHRNGIKHSWKQRRVMVHKIPEGTLNSNIFLPKKNYRKYLSKNIMGGKLIKNITLFDTLE